MTPIADDAAAIAAAMARIAAERDPTACPACHGTGTRITSPRWGEAQLVPCACVREAPDAE